MRRRPATNGLIALRGLPGSGKSTLAAQIVAEEPERTVAVSRDELRTMFHGRRLGTREQEEQVTQAEETLVRTMLLAGNTVVVHDTNLQPEHMERWQEVAFAAGANFGVIDLTDVPLETCLGQNALRIGTLAYVPEKVIVEMHTKWVAGRGYPLPRPEKSATEMYQDPGPGLPTVLVVDLDGTFCLRGDRSPYDETRVSEDTVNETVLGLVNQAADHMGDRIIFMSGRSERCRPDTERWLAEHYGRPYEKLLMRPAGDVRRDAVVKEELFDAEVRRQYRVRLVLDDRDQVVAMWRRLGLVVWQVADGDF